MKMETVYVLGAGASAAAALPGQHVLGNELLRRAFTDMYNDDRVKSIKQFVRDFFRCDVTREENLPTVEEVLSAVDIALERGEALSVTYTQERLQELRRNFAYLIYLVLDDCYQQLGNDVTQRFVDRLDPSPTIISFNYDVIIDWGLSHRERFGRWPDYGIDYRAFKGMYEPPGRSFVAPGVAKLYKIHGSLNWMVCPTCGVVYAGPPEKGKIVRFTFGGPNPARCAEESHALLEPLLITPTYLKSYGRPQVSLIWQRAERALRDAQRVVFIGYSLPEADFHIKYLLQKALFRSPRPKVIVVDLKQAGVERPTDEETRYKRLFGPEITYYTYGFAQYVDEEMEKNQ